MNHQGTKDTKEGKSFPFSWCPWCLGGSNSDFGFSQQSEGRLGTLHKVAKIGIGNRLDDRSNLARPAVS
jgi:hypothetical protein